MKPAWLPTPFASFPFISPPVRRRVPPDSVSTLPQSNSVVFKWDSATPNLFLYDRLWSFFECHLCGWDGDKQWSNSRRRSPTSVRKCSLAMRFRLLSHAVQIGCYHPQGQILNRKNDYMVSIYFYDGVKELAVRTICAGVYRDPTACHLRQMRKAILFFGYKEEPHWFSIKMCLIYKRKIERHQVVCVLFWRVWISLTRIKTK